MPRHALLVALMLWPLIGNSQVNVFTYHNDNARTGQNLNEVVLTPVNVGQLQKLYSFQVDGDNIFAQPLYVQGLSLPGQGTHNVLFVATEGDKVYAFDADNSYLPNGQALLWKADLLDSTHSPVQNAIPVPSAQIACDNIAPKIGITGTPVIDPSTGTLYVVAKSLEGTDYVHRLHALDVLSGTERPNSPVRISNAQPQFFDVHANNRAALLFSKGTVYVAFASHCDYVPWNGFVFAFDATTLAQTGTPFATTSTSSTARLGSGAGIWMNGSGVAADAKGNIYFATGNGASDNASNLQGRPLNGNYGNSIVKLTSTLVESDYFTTCDSDARSAADMDLGEGGVVLIPDQPGKFPHLLVQSGKVNTPLPNGTYDETGTYGSIYLLNRDRLASPHVTACNSRRSGLPPNSNVLQEIPNAVGNVGVPAYWNGSVYIRGADGALNRYAVGAGHLSPSGSVIDDPAYNANIAISANGASNGIVWALEISHGGVAAPPPQNAVLKAFDATKLALLYSSNTNPARDAPGTGLDMTSPIVANGKVFVGVAGQIAVYGLAKPNCPYGPDQCKFGYVWREAVHDATRDDHACVVGDVRALAWADNALASQRVSPTGGPYGPDTCIFGFVWREAIPGDHVCVTGATRSATQLQNLDAPNNVDPLCRLP